uniref:Uncharacterized protein n=1 Tax=Anopheles atroparvus TaxID=41427 RepID=A0A182IPG9_ANOAO
MTTVVRQERALVAVVMEDGFEPLEWHRLDAAMESDGKLLQQTTPEGGKLQRSDGCLERGKHPHTPYGPEIVPPLALQLSAEEGLQFRHGGAVAIDHPLCRFRAAEVERQVQPFHFEAIRGGALLGFAQFLPTTEHFLQTFLCWAHIFGSNSLIGDSQRRYALRHRKRTIGSRIGSASAPERF